MTGIRDSKCATGRLYSASAQKLRLWRNFGAASFWNPKKNDK